MSKPKTGDAAVAAGFIDQAKALVTHGQEMSAEQLEMLDPLTPEELGLAREALGLQASGLEVTREARARRRGRPPGARNKRTDDFARYLLSFGQHPAITMMQIQATPAEVLVERSRREKVHSYQKDGTPNVVIETMTLDAAESLRIRCATELLPYLESKRPVAVDMTFTGISDLIIQGVTHSEAEIADLLDGDFVDVDGDDAAEDGR